MQQDTFIRWPEVYKDTGLSKSSAYALIASGDFPRPVKLSARRVAWIKREVEEWIAARIAQSREQKPNEREPKKAAPAQNKRPE